jgi:hypothetical protein
MKPRWVLVWKTPSWARAVRTLSLAVASSELEKRSPSLRKRESAK